MKELFLLSLVLSIISYHESKGQNIRPQNPSPMVDYTRPHYRIPIDSLPDTGIIVDLSGGRQGRLYVPNKWKNEHCVDVVIHFHGDGRVAQYAVDQQAMPSVLLHCHWGSGSSAYSRPMQDLGPGSFLDTVMAAIQRTLPAAQIAAVYLSGWSAGYGAIRTMIGDEKVAERVDGIILLDGLHCSYLPEGKVMAEGGALDSTQMQPFLQWAKLAMSGEKSFLFTHSSVFPGAFASTTETAEYLLQTLGIKRQSQLVEGPVGMQQTSVATKGKLQIISFAGNSAPDHVDHYHGMWEFLRRVR